MVLSDIRKSAREALAGKWGKGALIVLAYFLFEFALSFVAGLLNGVALLGLVIEIATIVVSIPVSFGLIASFIKLKRGEEVKLFDFITYGFNNFKRAWKIAGNLFLKMWLPILLYIIAAIVLAVATTFGTIASVASGSAFFVGIATLVGFALFIPAFVFLFIKSLSYTLSYFIAYDNEAMTGKEVLEESNKLMTGNRGKYVLLQLSFIGWAILVMLIYRLVSFLIPSPNLALLTSYIPMLWLTPYIQVAMICFYEALKDNKSQE